MGREKGMEVHSDCLVGRVGRRSRRSFLTHFEIFRQRVDGVVIYFFNTDFKFFDDVLEFSLTSLYVVFIFSSKFMLNFLLHITRAQ